MAKYPTTARSYNGRIKFPAIGDFHKFPIATLFRASWKYQILVLEISSDSQNNVGCKVNEIAEPGAVSKCPASINLSIKLKKVHGHLATAKSQGLIFAKTWFKQVSQYHQNLQNVQPTKQFQPCFTQFEDGQSMNFFSTTYHRKTEMRWKCRGRTLALPTRFAQLTPN